jgi:hypothetical protein
MSDAPRDPDPGGPAQPFRDCVCMGLGPELTQFLRKLGPPEDAWHHVRHASVDVLKVLRTLIDQRIETLSREDDAVNPTPPSGTTRS